MKVTARGAGYAILQMSVQYNVDIERFQTEPPVKAFALQSSQYYYGRNQSHIEFQGCARYVNPKAAPSKYVHLKGAIVVNAALLAWYHSGKQ